MDETLNFVVNGNSYPISFPTVGDYYAIEASKQSLSLGFYNSLSESSVVSAYNATDMIDIEATLTILCPQLIKDLKCESFRKLGIKDYLMIKQAYIEQFVPWWKSIQELLNPKKNNEK